MKRIIFLIVSAVFHPLLMPLTGLCIIFNTGLFAVFPELRRNIYLIFLIATIILPLVLFSLLYNLRLIKTIYLEEHKERVVPLFLTALLYLVLFIFMRSHYFAAVLQSYMLGVTLTTLVLFIISFFWKISLHMAGIGGLTGLIFSLIIQMKINLVVPVIVVIIVSGLIGTSRLSTGSHKPLQVYAGYFLGLFIILLTTLYYNLAMH